VKLTNCGCTLAAEIDCVETAHAFQLYKLGSPCVAVPHASKGNAAFPSGVQAGFWTDPGLATTLTVSVHVTGSGVHGPVGADPDDSMSLRRRRRVAALMFAMTASALAASATAISTPKPIAEQFVDVHAMPLSVISDNITALTPLQRAWTLLR
jgi:hypothetical protein